MKKEEGDETTPSDELNDDTLPWKQRTHLTVYMRSKKTAAMGLKEQNPDIQKMIHASYEFGKLALVVGDPEELLKMSDNAVLKLSSPFSPHGLEDIAHRALIKAADANGYNGEYDIAHRLEEGSATLYIQPLQDYVSISTCTTSSLPR